MLKLVPDNLKTKKICKHAPYRLRYVPNEYKAQQMCDKAVSENEEILNSAPDCYKNQEINKVIKKLIITLMHYNLFLNVIRL